MVIFRPDAANQLDTLKNITDKLTKLQTKPTTQQTPIKAENRVTVPLASTVEPSMEAKFNDILKDVKAGEIPQLMRFLKNKKFVG